MTIAEMLTQIRIECDRLGIDESIVSIDVPLKDDEDFEEEQGWWCGLDDGSIGEDQEHGFVAPTLEEALQKLLTRLQEEDDVPEPS